MAFLDSDGFCKNTANLIQEVYDEESKQLNITFLIQENCNFRCIYFMKNLRKMQWKEKGLMG